MAQILVTLVIGLAGFQSCLAGEVNLEDRLQRIIAEEGLAGIGWSLVGGNGEITSGALGVQDMSTGTPFTIETRFHVGSLTKTVLATGVLRLATEGRINLDSPVTRYLPALFSGEPPTYFSKITVRHLLDHTAGLNDAHMWQLFSKRADPNSPLSSAFPNPEAQLQVRSRPGTQYSYSNMGYALLGMLVEAIVGVRYETYLDEHVLAPLGMHNSTFTYTTQDGMNLDPMLAWGHVDDGSRYAASPVFLRPAGQFTSTSADLAQFAQFLLSDGTVADQVFIEETLMRSRARPFGTEAANQGLIAGYALGLGRRDRHGVIGNCHGGNIVGFVAMLCIFPDEQKAFAYSVNTDSETADFGRLDNAFIEALNVAKAFQPEGAAATTDISQWQGYYTLSPNRFHMFKYVDKIFGSIKISATGEFLTLASLQKENRELRPLGAGLFSANDRSTASHVFYQGEEGEYRLSDGFQTFERIPTVYIMTHWASVFLGLTGLLWILVSGSISLIRYRLHMLQRAEAPAFMVSMLLFAPIPLFFNQSFMALGDLTLASGMLAVVSILLPIGMLSTVVLCIKKLRLAIFDVMNAVAAALVLQWCLVLLAAGMLPFRLWA